MVSKVIGQALTGLASTDTSPIFLLVTGQSNTIVAPNFATAPPSNTKIWNNSFATDNSVGTAFVPLSITTTHIGHAIASELGRKYPNRMIYLLVIGKDGLTIDHWTTNGITPFDMLANIEANIYNALAAAGMTKVSTILFWQGESDALAFSTTWSTDFETWEARAAAKTWFPTQDGPFPNWVIFGIGGAPNNSTVHDGIAFNNTYILPTVQKDLFNRWYVDTAAANVSYWATSVAGGDDPGYPGHLVGHGYWQVGRLVARALYGDIASGFVVGNGRIADGYPWDAYAPVVTSGTGAINSYTASGLTKQVGKTVDFTMDVTISDNGNGGAHLEVTLPAPAAADTVFLAVNGANVIPLMAYVLVSFSATKILIFSTTGTYPSVSGGALVISGRYQRT